MTGYTETRTQEDITELHAEHGLGCKDCGQPIEPGTAYACDGDIYCPACAAQLRVIGGRPQLLPHRPAAPADELYGCTGADAQWIRDNVGLD